MIVVDGKAVLIAGNILRVYMPRDVLKVSYLDELLQGFVLLSGDAQSGVDAEKLSGAYEDG